MSFIFQTDLFHRPLHRSGCQSGTSHGLPSGHFTSEGGVVPFRDDIKGLNHRGERRERVPVILRAWG